jgi:hypothetical protein
MYITPMLLIHQEMMPYTHLGCLYGNDDEFWFHSLAIILNKLIGTNII